MQRLSGVPMSTHNKSISREYAFCFLYHIYSLNEYKDYKEDELKQKIEEFENIRSDTLVNKSPYAMELINGIIKNNNQILEVLKIKLGIKIKNIKTVEKTLLYMANYELNFTNIPPKVILTEVIKLAKKYGDTKSYAFINGMIEELIKKK